jgi:hypothetical protein
MSNYKVKHRNPTEESRFNTIFDKSLQPKMSPIDNFDDMLDLLRYSYRLNSEVQLDVLSRIALFWSYFPALVRSLIIIQLVGGI